MHFFIYNVGHLIVSFLYFNIFSKKNNVFSLLEKLLFLSAALIPIGKLFYFPVPGMYGLKFAFIFGSIVAFFWFIFIGVNRNTNILLLTVLFPVLSLLYIENYDWIFLYQLTLDQKESSLLRLVSFISLVLYCAVIYTSILRNKLIYVKLADYYVMGTFLASVVGVFIFYFVSKGRLTSEDLDPISAGVHIVSLGSIIFYRFNPGANVNEFSVILAYAMFLMPFTSFSKKNKLWLVALFLLLEFATLTRATWLGLILSSFIAMFFLSGLKRNLNFLLISIISFIVVLALVYSNSEDFRFLIDSRMSMDIGASGHERLDKFGYVFERLGQNDFRFLFGYGWATNMYVHSVYLQLAYEIGVLGLILFIASIFLFIRNAFFLNKGVFKASFIACIFLIIIVSSMHHVLYHMQTWFVFAFIAGVSVVLRNEYKRLDRRVSLI